MVRLRAAALFACSPFGPCTLDRIDASFPVTVAIGDALQEWTLTGRVTETNLDPDTYGQLVAGLGWIRRVPRQAGFLAIWLGR